MSNQLIDLETAQGALPNYMRQALDYIYDPQAIQRLAIGHVESILDGTVKITDATNPFVTLMGISAANVSAGVISNSVQLRSRYPVLANTAQELYNHMSDRDYDGRFASPATKKVLCLVSFEELKKKLVLQPDGSKKIVISRYTNVEVEGTVFTLMYPVVIRELIHGDLSVHYDLAISHPLQNLTSSEVYWTTRDGRGSSTKFLQLELDLVQIRASVFTYDLNPSIGIEKTVQLVDNYCSARVWYKNSSSPSWVEIKTTHSDMVYDVNTPTAVLTVTDSNVGIRIPQVYFTTGAISGKLRFDVFTTKGVVFINAEGKNVDNFLSTWSGETNETVTTEMSAWQSIQSKYLIIQGIIQGGSGAITFDQLREQVITGSVGLQIQPITPSQLKIALQADGYILRQYVDTVTTRQVLASKALPSSKDKILITPASATIASVLMAASVLKTSPWVADNGERITITPDALWQLKNGNVRMVSGQELTDVLALDPDTRVGVINQSGYLYSPYYYVLDSSVERFNVRPYHLSTPKASVAKYVGENDTTGLQIEIASISLINYGNGWIVQVTTLSNTAWKEQDISYRHAQLNFEPLGIGAPAAINAVATVTDKGEDLFVFYLPSGYDIDSNHRISQSGFHAITTDVREVYCDLIQNFQLVFASSAPLPLMAQASALDALVVKHALPNRLVAVSVREVTLEFGVFLKHLWASCRTLAPIKPWQTYPSDVPAIHDKDTYEINPITGTEVFFDLNNEVYFKKLASVGEVIVSEGLTVLEHRAGDVVYSGGVAVEVTQDTLQRQFDMLFFEGSYYFATDTSTTQYTTEIVDVLTSYITVDLPKFATRVLEKTDIFFYPKVSLGTVNVILDAGVVTQIPADQSLTVRLGVHTRVYDNAPLRSQLEFKTIQTIQDFFTQEALSISELINRLRSVYAGDVVSVQVNGLGGANNANAITMLNANERCSVKKRVTVLDNGEFTVREDVIIDFFNHSTP